MRKFAALLVLIMLTLMMLCTNTMADLGGRYGSVVNGPAILYEEARTTSTHITSLADDTGLLLLDSYGSWYFVRDILEKCKVGFFTRIFNSMTMVLTNLYMALL